MVEMQVEVYSAASDASEKDDMVQTAIILNCPEPHRFWNIPYQDTFDKSLTELKTRAASCNFKKKIV